MGVGSKIRTVTVSHNAASLSEISQRSLKCLGQAIERAQTSLVAECRVLDSTIGAGLYGLRVGNRFLCVTKMCNRVLQMKLMLLIMGTTVSPLCGMLVDIVYCGDCVGCVEPFTRLLAYSEQ